MLNRLKLKNFVKHKDLEIEFEKGTTLISGANGAGKSLIQEAIRFALFGTGALRGKLDDYDQGLRVELDLSIKGKPYSIIRSLFDCKFGGEGVEVVGTKACNLAIKKALGYGMLVFDMGNCAKQEEITKLSDMKPSERKQAIDEVLGIAVVDKLVRELNVEVSELKGKLEGVKWGLHEPDEVEIPGGYDESRDLNTEIELERKRKNEIAVCEAVLAQALPSAPVPPDGAVMEKPAGDPSTEGAFKALKLRVSTLGEMDYNVEELEVERERTRAFANRDKLEQPTITKEEIKNEREKWELYRRYVRSNPVVCPNCSYEFNPISGERVGSVAKPSSIESELDRQEKLHNTLDNLPSWDGVIPKYRWTDIEFYKQISRLKELAQVKQALEVIEPCDYNAWRLYNEYKIKQEAFEREKSRYEGLVSARCKYTEMLKSLREGYEAEKLSELEKTRETWDYYKRSVKRYKEEKRAYEEGLKYVKELEEKIEIRKNAVDGLKDFKLKIKSYVVPSLAKVASELVREMTCGEFDKIEIDDKFEVTLDGKTLNLLSGSEKAVANLALRIGLGRVLTHKSLNLFMGDEIDASCSEERANAMMNSLKRLSGNIEQMIFISHHGVECEHEVKL